MAKNQSSQKVKKMFVEAATKLQHGDAEGARKGLEKVAKIIPENPTVQYNLALAYQHLEQHLKALQGYQKVLKLEPGHVDALINLGLAQNALKQTEDAEKSARKALQQAENHSRALNLLGTIQAEKGELEAAEEYFSRSFEIDEANVDTRYNLASTRFQSGHFEAAFDVIRSIASTDSASHIIELYCYILINLKKHEEAKSVLNNLKQRSNGKNQNLPLLELSFAESTKDYFAVIEHGEQALKSFFRPGHRMEFFR